MRFALLALLFPLGLLAQDAAKKPAVAPAPQREPGLYATIKTSMGDIVCKLYEKEAPMTVKNFVGLAMGTKTWTDPKTGKPVVHRSLYAGTTFHRVIPDFMIQGGDPKGDGTGSPGYQFKNEDNQYVFDKKGLVAMANAGRDTNGSQFFVTVAAYPSLNGGYTVFGQVVEGQDVADKISRVPTDASNNRPLTPVTIIKISILRVHAPGEAPAVHRRPAAHAAAPKS